jgi:hypothetical protein
MRETNDRTTSMHDLLFAQVLLDIRRRLAALESR